MKAVAIASTLISLGTIFSPAMAQETTTEQTAPITIAQATQPLDTVIRSDETLYLDKNAVHEYNLRLQSRTAVGDRFFVGNSYYLIN